MLAPGQHLQPLLFGAGSNYDGKVISIYPLVGHLLAVVNYTFKQNTLPVFNNPSTTVNPVLPKSFEYPNVNGVIDVS